ncbi:DMT family transporter [Meiothermus ruber]|jgi:small multidrug resistance pump|uniref:Small multidrug resistance protein n=1 Tax=Meiothermus ruber (strain ATCC 35948 / DSM 1279 / VKM B-1258 / 21) TaxID=504728 RepID=D3PPU6_MEIRD|nr:multidrug efflux SMR transporter [Meiothermus ruber]ADD27572.1 small multidrug resistance protein [Meiothermus ruber DSM 1279]AGK04037.1 small multidrug resistance protein [Meiothermus ruber DSM 1279]MCL6529890.1 multidrug efflux SMR transporter [Meiothermus ruber]GAO74500.1 small multidrug resistance protein [Meiothermus ruber H328]
MNGWLLLMIAIVSEVIGSTALKASQGFSKLLPSLVVVLGYGLAFYFLSLSLKTIPLNIAYAVWSGLGTALIALLGWWVLKEPMNGAIALGILLIIAGVVVLNLASRLHL